MDRLKRLKGLAARFLRQTQGNVAMMFALALPVLVMITLGAIDIHQASKVKAQLQDALDAAALAAARSTFTDDVNINKVGLAALKANMPGYFGAQSQDTANFVLVNNRVTGDARVNVKVLVANIVLPPYGKLLDDYLPVSSHSEVLRASRNVEVAMALDITGSMKGQPLKDLKAAAIELIGIVVQDQQSPFTSRVALAPYAVGVNLGDYATAARGAIPGPLVSISGAEWKVGNAKSISGITRASSVVITSSAHGFANDDYVWISGVRGMTQMNGRALQVVNRKNDSFSLRVPGQSNALNSSNFTTYSSAGTIQKCLVSDCSVVITSNNHGLQKGRSIWIDEVVGMTQLNKQGGLVNDVTAHTFSTGIPGASTSTYNQDGRVWCADQGCQGFRFGNMDGGVSTFEVSTCASERIGAEAYTDAAPSRAYVGRSYTDGGNRCPSQPMTPLTSDRAGLRTKINALEDDGSTAGQIGIAWAWYLVSPNFASLFTGEGRPNPHNPSETLKAVILMTDGEFNTPFCKDVIASDATTGSGGNNTHINCKATNGEPFAQSVALCAAMKHDNIVVYTVGFNLSTSRGKAGIDTAVEVMETCATNKDTHFFMANSGKDLKEAFQAIGRDITRLRIAG